MIRRYFVAEVLMLGLCMTGGYAQATEDSSPNKTPTKTSRAWTFEEAMRQLALHPNDTYLQYTALQLADSKEQKEQIGRAIQQLFRRRGRARDGRRVDLFSMFTGALAVQESLQLDTMRPDLRPDGAEETAKETLKQTAKDTVKVADLVGPTIKSHPWGKMLAAQLVSGKQPDVSPLAMCAPEDQYFVTFHSIDKLLEATELGDLWGAHLFTQAARSAKTQKTSRRIKSQLAVHTDPLSRPFYDMVVQQIALTGSDLYFREGSDVTMLFLLKQPDVFKLRMDGFLAEAEKSRPDAERSSGRVAGVEYVCVRTPDRAVCAYSAYPKPNVHVRSNSKPALRRAIEAVTGRTADGDRVKRLGESTEFKYIRTLMPRGAEEEDGFVYLSDPFIRRLVGPQLKLAERRRMLCYNHLRMIGHAAMLYRTQYGTNAKSLKQLADGGCAPGEFGEGRLRCPCGGKYELSADGTQGVCSHHGHAQGLTPCLEIPLAKISKPEAEEYKTFLDRYKQYWRTYFDPIAIRLRLDKRQYRAETIILPLLDNSVYSGMAMTLGGEPEPLDALPVPQRNIFSMAVKLDKKKLLESKQGRILPSMLRELKLPKDEAQRFEAALHELLTRGVGNQVGMHVYDASPMFDFNLTGFLGDMMGRFRGVGGGMSDEMLPISFLLTSLNSPVYIAVPVEDAQIVDRFLNQLDTLLATTARRPTRPGWFRVDYDFYRVPLDSSDDRVRCYSVRFGPIKWRLFFARLGDGLYIASKRFILDDLAAATKDKRLDSGPTAHAMVRVRPEYWNQMLPDLRLGWAESSRQACLNNLGSLSNVARAMNSGGGDAVKAADIHRRADELHAVHFFCPDGGRYQLSPDGRRIVCSLHGSASAPRQLAAPSKTSPAGRLMNDFSGLTASLTFLEDGLHAVVTVDRK